MLPLEIVWTPSSRLAPSLRRMMEPLPYSFSIEATARSIALPLFFVSSIGDDPRLRGRGLALASRAALEKLYCQSVQLSRKEWLRRLGLVLLAEALLFLCNCDGDSRPTGSQSRQLLPKRAPVETVAKVLAVDASDFEPKLDPVAPPGDLHAEMESFTTVEACVQQRAHIDPMLGDALEAIGYDTFFADACRVVDAAKAGDAKRCLGIATSALRMHCRAAVAQLRATPNACPWTQPSRRRPRPGMRGHRGAERAPLRRGTRSRRARGMRRAARPRRTRRGRMPATVFARRARAVH